MLEPDLLTSFVAIAESGSFTESAKRVHRTQSAVSMQIKRLEEQIGRPLFVREGRAVRLSPDGEILLGHARRILKAHHEAQAIFGAPPINGTVRFGTPDEYAVSFLPAVLARFAASHPLVHVEVVCDPTARIVQRMDAGELDFSFITCRPENCGRVLLREPLVWATSAKHDAERQDPVPLALFHAGCPFRQWAVDAFAGSSRDYRIAYTSVSLAGIEAALRAGLAVSVLPRSNISPGLRVLGEADGFPPLPNYQLALQRASGAQGPLFDRFEQHVLDHFRQAVWSEAA